MINRLIILVLLIMSCNPSKKIASTTSNQFPLIAEKVTALPAKENFYIFILAGQSNMAGRGIVQPVDTVSSPNVLTLNKGNEWVYAKEPLHYYEPTRTGLDCGLSFGKTISKLYGKNITIGIVPCAIGGSSIEQWLGDSTYRNVTLYSNFVKKAKIASQDGTIRGILWHQGESNATASSYKNYKKKLQTFIQRVRNDLGDVNLPFYAGELASFLNKSNYTAADSVNRDLHILSETMNKMFIINTSDLTSLKDTLHFDSRSQRLMGERFARAVFNNK